MAGVPSRPNTWARSEGPSLHAQPAPWLYLVSRTFSCTGRRIRSPGRPPILPKFPIPRHLCPYYAHPAPMAEPIRVRPPVPPDSFEQFLRDQAAVAVIATDLAGQITHENSAAAAVVGW